MSLMHEAQLSKLPWSTTVSDRAEPARRSGLELVTLTAEWARANELTTAGFLLARTARSAVDGILAPDLPVRGGLREAIEGAIEMALALRGAVPPNVALGAGTRAMASDQLFRTRALGARGLCLVVPELGRIADEHGVLDDRDSEALRVWKSLSEEAPIVLLLDDSDRGVSVQLPVAIDSWLATVPSLDAPLVAAWAGGRSQQASHERQGAFDCEPDEFILDREASEEPFVNHEAQHDSEDAHAAVAEADRPTLRDPARTGYQKQANVPAPEANGNIMRHDPLADLEDDDGALDDARLFDGLFTAPSRAAGGSSHLPSLPLADPSVALTPSPAPQKLQIPKREQNTGNPVKRPRHPTSRGAMTRALESDGQALQGRSRAPMTDLQPEQTVELTRDRRTVEAPARPARRFDTSNLRAHAATLVAARGSRPVRQIEQLYVEHYVPLLEAFSAGYTEHDAEQALTGWRSSFEKSYQESFASIRVTGKRPKMVLDAPEEAVRIGKLNGARSVQIVLVDAMRFGLGERVQRRLEASMSDLGTCVEQQVLWAALPSVTSVQMQLLAQGARGLRDIETPNERDLTAFRDGTACTPRRERIGQRDLMKLDVVEARLREAGPAFETRMDDLAEEVADSVVKVAEGLPPRTMMYLFGDHGFQLRAISDSRTARAEQGGARPEEVLVPGYAWLIGGAH